MLLPVKHNRRLNILMALLRCSLISYPNTLTYVYVSIHLFVLYHCSGIHISILALNWIISSPSMTGLPWVCMLCYRIFLYIYSFMYLYKSQLGQCCITVFFITYYASFTYHVVSFWSCIYNELISVNCESLAEKQTWVYAGLCNGYTFDGRSTAYQRSLRSQWRHPLAAVKPT